MPRFLTLAALFAAVLAAQESKPQEPPPDVDKALRARIAEFYQYHVDAQYRKAESLVAEDTKDFFYTANKPKYLSFVIQSIAYSDDFTKAKAVVLCEQYLAMPIFAGRPMKVPTPSTWKLEDGKWYWYVDPASLRVTPFGTSVSAPAPAAGSLPAIPTTAEFALNKVKADKSSLSLKPGESGEVTFSNSAPGRMTVALEDKVPGIEVTPGSVQMNQGEKAAFKLKVLDGAKSAVVSFKVEQTAEILPVRVEIH
ncbi:MAG: hypothetical protein LAQ30_01120 [Acidobacteriia bacterium]|nr:hypothetical protein [Terriglobia bacterium]